MTRGYGQFCPVAKASEVFAERWTPLVLRELLAGYHRFNDLRRGVPLMSRTLLAQRLKELEAAGIVRSVPKPAGMGNEYYLTEAGEAFRPILELLGGWGARWARGRFEMESLDASLLMWSVRRRINMAAVPEKQVVVRFEFSGLPRGRQSHKTWWLVLNRDDVDLCLTNPGFEVDLIVRADLGTFTRAYVDPAAFRAALRSGAIALDGPRPLKEALPAWLYIDGSSDVPSPLFSNRHQLADQPDSSSGAAHMVEPPLSQRRQSRVRIKLPSAFPPRNARRRPPQPVTCPRARPSS
jgi:DNA-binding HxlR family transcriptional regulator